MTVVVVIRSVGLVGAVVWAVVVVVLGTHERLGEKMEHDEGVDVCPRATTVYCQTLGGFFNKKL